MGLHIPEEAWMDICIAQILSSGSGIRYVDRIDLSPDRDRWTTLVNSVMNLRIP